MFTLYIKKQELDDRTQDILLHSDCAIILCNGLMMISLPPNAEQHILPCDTQSTMECTQKVMRTLYYLPDKGLCISYDRMKLSAPGCKSICKFKINIDVGVLIEYLCLVKGIATPITI